MKTQVILFIAIFSAYTNIKAADLIHEEFNPDANLIFAQNERNTSTSPLWNNWEFYIREGRQWFGQDLLLTQTIGPIHYQILADAHRTDEHFKFFFYINDKTSGTDNKHFASFRLDIQRDSQKTLSNPFQYMLPINSSQAVLLTRFGIQNPTNQHNYPQTLFIVDMNNKHLRPLYASDLPMGYPVYDSKNEKIYVPAYEHGVLQIDIKTDAVRVLNFSNMNISAVAILGSKLLIHDQKSSQIFLANENAEIQKISTIESPLKRADFLQVEDQNLRVLSFSRQNSRPRLYGATQKFNSVLGVKSLLCQALLN